MDHELLKAPREGASDDTVKVGRWLVAAGTRVARGEPVVEIETSKAAIVIEAHRDGFLDPLATLGQRVDVGAARTLDRVRFGVDIVSAQVDRLEGDVVSVAPIARNRNDAARLELPRAAARSGKRAAVLGEDGANV